MNRETMRWNRSLALLLAAGMAFAAFAAQAGDGAGAPPVRKVVRMASGAVAFVAEGEGFRRDGAAEGRVVLPAPVLEESPRGYVRVEGNDGPLWLDELDVDIEPRKTASAAACPPASRAVSNPNSSMLAATRGAGESCTP